MQVFEQLKDCRSIKNIAAANNMSPLTAAKVVDLIGHAPAKLHEVLAIDEFRGNAEGERFQCILADPKNHKVLDIFPSRKHEDIYAYLGKFHNRNDVKVVVMDMT